MPHLKLLSAATAFFLSACTPAIPPADPAYLKAHADWNAARMAELKAPDGWLALAGLFWLEPGANTFGSDSSNQVIFPAKSPARMGTFYLEGDSVRMELAPDIQAIESTAQNKVSSATLRLIPGTTPATYRREALEWVLLERGGRYGIRLWDRENPAMEAVKNIPTFPVHPGWVTKATLVPVDSSRKVRMQNVLGMTIEQASAGILEFKKAGATYRLEALEDADGYFLIFADATTGDQTYSGGRYLHAPLADKNGQTILDFNKAYNPPCVFTPYATCLLPPAANRLEIAIEAGEKTLPGH
ncbi:MAG: DUF1684 domain-containing protein [Saprospiraceae bacterium]